MESQPPRRHKSWPYRKRTWMVALIVIVGTVGYWVWGDRVEGELHRLEADMKDNLPLRVDENTTLVDVKYERTKTVYWYVIRNRVFFDPQQAKQSVQAGLCGNVELVRNITEKAFSYEYHYKTAVGIPLADFKITSCP